jgi:hypothetical protein
MTLTGFEPLSARSSQNSTLGKLPIQGAAESDADSTNSTPLDADLVWLIDAWPTVLPPIRRAIMALVENP